MSPRRPVKDISCSRCKIKKIRCNKVRPKCDKCDAVNAECFYLPRKERQKKSMEKDVLANVLKRLDRLEKHCFLDRLEDNDGDTLSARSDSESNSPDPERTKEGERSQQYLDIFYQMRYVGPNFTKDETISRVLNDTMQEIESSDMTESCPSTGPLPVSKETAKKWINSMHLPLPLELGYRLTGQVTFDIAEFGVLQNPLGREFMCNIADLLENPYVQLDKTCLMIFYSWLLHGMVLDKTYTHERGAVAQQLYEKCAVLVDKWQNEAQNIYLDFYAGFLMVSIALEGCNIELAWKVFTVSCKIAKALGHFILDENTPDEHDEQIQKSKDNETFANKNRMRYEFWYLVQVDCIFRLYFGRPACIPQGSWKIHFLATMRYNLVLLKYFDLTDNEHTSHPAEYDETLDNMSAEVRSVMSNWKAEDLLETTTSDRDLAFCSDIVLNGYKILIILQNSKKCNQQIGSVSPESVETARVSLNTIQTLFKTCPQLYWGTTPILLNQFIPFLILCSSITGSRQHGVDEKDLRLVEWVSDSLGKEAEGQVRTSPIRRVMRALAGACQQMRRILEGIGHRSPSAADSAKPAQQANTRKAPCPSGDGENGCVMARAVHCHEPIMCQPSFFRSLFSPQLRAVTLTIPTLPASQPTMKFPSRISARISDFLLDRLAEVVKVGRNPHPYIDGGWEASRRFLFSVIFISLLLSKCFHMGVHLHTLTVSPLSVWAPTFFLVDCLLILVGRGLACWFERRPLRYAAAVSTVLLSLYYSSMICSNISFYVHIGKEIHWRKPKRFHRSSPSALLVLSALGLAFLLDALIMGSAYLATPYLYRGTGAFVRIWGSSFMAVYRWCRQKRDKARPNPEMFEQLSIDDEDEEMDTESAFLLDAPHGSPKKETEETPPKESLDKWSWIKRIIVVSCTLFVLILRCFRPSDAAYGFLSGSLPLAPFGGPRERFTLKSAEFDWLKNHTALDTTPEFDWLPRNRAIPGFADWAPKNRNSSEHYNPLKDPLHIPNLQNDLLEPLKEVLHDGGLKIKHVILVKLESTRQDVFPFRSDSYVMDKIKESYDGDVPSEVELRLANLTRTAERLTGSDTGFNKDGLGPTPYGGISAKNAYTAGTYTLKSIVGSVCGVNAIAVDKDYEYLHDFYQPCLSHIFRALNRRGDTSNKTDDWTSWPWHTVWMQSMFATYDKQRALTSAMGYKEIVAQGSINAGGRKYTSEEDEIEDYGYHDKVLRNYIRDAIVDAESNNTRLFLSHLTGNTHHPWQMPGEYEEMMGNSWSGRNKEINMYLNTVGYQDEWLADILDVLEETGVANETLLVMAGDHGLSLPNDGGHTPYHNPHVSSFHVPLFFSHPSLPPIEIDSAVLSTQILPTILDFLIESSSLNEKSTKIMKDLLPMYEGQSMLRPLIPSQDGKREWQFTVMNPGGTWVGIRSASEPYRLVAPLKSDAQWRFTNVDRDPFELQPDEDYDLRTLIDAVQTWYGPEAAGWLNEAGHVALWWFEENHRRWKFDPEEVS